MPELTSEFPDSQELTEYFNQHWQETGKYIEEIFVELQIDGSPLTKKIYKSILDSLFRLNEFSRDHKFWNNTNKKPTIYKLNEFCRLLINDNGEDELALWTLFSLGQIYGSNNLELNETNKLWKINVEILILAYLHSAFVYDSDPTNISSWFTKLNYIEKARPILKKIMTAGNDWTQNFVKQIQETIGEI